MRQEGLCTEDDIRRRKSTSMRNVRTAADSTQTISTMYSSLFARGGSIARSENEITNYEKETQEDT